MERIILRSEIWEYGANFACPGRHRYGDDGAEKEDIDTDAFDLLKSQLVALTSSLDDIACPVNATPSPSAASPDESVSETRLSRDTVSTRGGSDASLNAPEIETATSTRDKFVPTFAQDIERGPFKTSAVSKTKMSRSCKPRAYPRDKQQESKLAAIGVTGRPVPVYQTPRPAVATAATSTPTLWRPTFLTRDQKQEDVLAALGVTGEAAPVDHTLNTSSSICSQQQCVQRHKRR